jgi:diguanylate cyclase (GGDEF)-like protein/PAS domain S-box-containing protein
MSELGQRIKPQQVRLLGLMVALFLLALIWTTYLLANRSIGDSFQSSTLQTLESETTLLEEQVVRSFNLATTILVTLGEMTNALMVAPEVLTPEELSHAIANTQVIRSLSLVDEHGFVLSSSNPMNVGRTIDIASLRSDEQSVAWRINGVYFGQILPHRDIHDWSGTQASPTQQMIPATYEITQGDRSLTWVATINVSYFHNVWERMGHNPAVEIAVFNYEGTKILAHHEHDISQALFKDIAAAISSADIGHFYVGAAHQYLVVYRSNLQSPLIIASIADMKALGSETAETRRFLLLISVIGTLITIFVFSILYLLYLRQLRATRFSDRLLTGITAHMMMVQSDLEGVIERVNQPVLDLTGYTEAELVGQNLRIFKSGLEHPSLFETMWKTIADGKIWRGTFRNKTKDGNIIWLNATVIPFRDEWGALTQYVTLYSDVTEAILLSKDIEHEKTQRAALEVLNDKLRSEATSDPLTGLANRRRLDEFMSGIRERSDLSGMSLSVLAIDLDHFKEVNDTWGHAAGDEVLRVVSKVWMQSVRSSDLLVRVGGEEFALILPRTSIAQAKQVAQKLCDQTAAVEINVPCASKPIQQTISIGIACSNDINLQSIDDLLEQADKALYWAKRRGRNRIVIFDADDPANAHPE